VLAPYVSQRQLYSTLMVQAAKTGGFDVNEFPRIEIVDSFQGKDSRMVILDLVVTSGDALGFMIDEKRMNVSCTRAMEVFWMVGNRDLLEAERFERWKPAKKNNRGQNVPNPLPYILECVRYLYVWNRYVDKKPDASAVQFPRNSSLITYESAR